MTLYDAVCTMIIQDPALVLDINTFEEELCDMFEEQIKEHCTVSVFGAEYSMSPLDLYRFDPTLASQIWDEFFSDEIYDHIYEHVTSSGAISRLIAKMDDIKKLVDDDADEDPAVIGMVADPKGTLTAMVKNALKEDYVIREIANYMKNNVCKPIPE